MFRMVKLQNNKSSINEISHVLKINTQILKCEFV